MIRLRHSPLLLLALLLAGLLYGRAHTGCAHSSAPEVSAPTHTVTADAVTADAGTADAGLPFSDPERMAEINRTLELIEKGGPFPHRQDGSIFVNREGRLPEKQHGYYHEYTVRTPGVQNRGARRIVRGDGGELYYSDDHYKSFIPLPGRPAP